MLKIMNKDLRVMLASKSQIALMLFIVPLFLLIVDANNMGWLYFLILIIVAYTLIITPFSFDVSNKTIGLINSFPISRKEIVISKYLSVFPYMFISVIYSGIYLWVINKSGILGVDYFNIAMIGRACLYMIFVSSLIFPANFKFDARLAQLVNVFFYSGGIVLTFNLAEANINSNLVFLGNLYSPLTLTVVVVIIYILSMILSIRIYENRDL
ncbi:MAG: ABC-2 transporter permease [Epulopiscium sp.]|nr:ABC-2 transporter permease [Candidatus Epulonipiscium sp.]